MFAFASVGRGADECHPDLGSGIGGVEALAHGSYFGGAGIGRIDETSISVLVCGRQGMSRAFLVGAEKLTLWRRW